MKTDSEKIEISKQVAEIVGMSAPSGYLPGKACVGMTERWGMAEHGPDLILGWLVDDHGACAEIAADRRITIDQSQDDRVIVIYIYTIDDLKYYEEIEALLADFPSRIEATSWAILQAVIEQAKQS